MPAVAILHSANEAAQTLSLVGWLRLLIAKLCPDVLSIQLVLLKVHISQCTQGAMNCKGMGGWATYRAHTAHAFWFIVACRYLCSSTGEPFQVFRMANNFQEELVREELRCSKTIQAYNDSMAWVKEAMQAQGYACLN